MRLFHTEVKGSKEEIDSMDSLRKDVKKTGWENCFPYDWFYIHYETNKVSPSLWYMEKIAEVCTLFFFCFQNERHNECTQSFAFIQIIQSELYLNVGLAFVCIILMALLLLAHLGTWLLVSACVVMSVVSLFA